MSINWDEVLTAQETELKEYERVKALVEQQRKNEYAVSADPLFFKWQRGDGSKQEWLDAVQAVKDANPYPVQETK